MAPKARKSQTSNWLEPLRSLIDGSFKLPGGKLPGEFLKTLGRKKTLGHLTRISETKGGGSTALGRREREKGCPLGFLFLFFALLFGPNLVGLATAGELQVSPLATETDTGRHVFQVELATTEAARTRGLMFRDALAPDHGMLFDYGDLRHISMWMKNTLIPLDMVFLDEAGRVVKISVDATPGSLESITSDGLARGVLELLAGTAARIGVRPGDKVSHQVFGDPPEVPEDKTPANVQGG